MSTIPPHDLETGQAVIPTGQVASPMGQRQVNVDQNGIIIGQWKSGICGCLDACVPNFLMVWFCPCISFAQTRHRLNGSFWSSCCLFTLCFGLPIFCIRGEVRARFRIPGSCCEDVCCACCCPICVLTQVATHTESYTPGSCNFGPKDHTLLGCTASGVRYMSTHEGT
ncbi:hypothetical protein SPRG_09193 [Saprolegnia parasitica CBS 223.65]|uniref:PLAC8 family protein n=1 Tax=Saprolegnia parasitica (strain CBS 223.65) TaxID=695850 RepID=A0A067C3K7_SAPPC|nr:hypothetical protein SPRG_09193 [Saprolegnia parasitica CBS 223.65]KDO25369.1 hypothetical protein SPRG_09193 [Saprolegnia parasitica CBS 223.65]|eukprot:XP_012204015.1 hypothetical protein SPRG_09193 [Saprolegnia parasitica CBS 223.65]